MTDFTTDIAQALVRKEDLKEVSKASRKSRQHSSSYRINGYSGLRKIGS